MATTIELKLLGEFQASVNAVPVSQVAWENRKAAELVKALALAPGFRMPRDQLIDLFWPHLEPEAGAAALHKAASQARSALGFAESIVVRGGEVALAPESTVTCDVVTFETAARKAMATSDVAACAKAAALCGGELLPNDRYAEWPTPHRERLRAMQLDLLRKAGAWKEVVAKDPNDESAHLALMKAYAAAGERAAALRQFRQLRETLSRDLGVTPSPEALAVYEEVSRGPAVHAPLSATRPIVGRQVELGRALALLRSTSERRGATLLVRGEGGVGKTRFCEALLDAAAKEGVTTLRGTSPAEAGHAFAPLTEAFDRLLAERLDLADKLTETARSVLARLATGLSSSAENVEPITRQQVLSAAAQLLTVIAKERPVLMLLDDLHVADESSLQLFTYLSRHAHFDRIMMVAAYRPGAGEALQKLEAALLAQRAATAIDLGPLTRPETVAIAQQAAAEPLSDAALDAIWRAAHGNPFLTELLATSPEGAASPGASELIEARLARLEPQLFETLQQLAVLGDSFAGEEAIAFLSLPEAESFRRLDLAVDKRLLDRERGGYRFHHGIVRDELLRRLSAQQRREAHGRAADALARVGASANRITTHLTGAERAPEATPWLVQAARDESRVGGFASALELIERASKDGEPDVEVLSMRAELLMATGDPRAPEAFETATRRARGPRREALQISHAQSFIAMGDMMSAIKKIGEVQPPEAPESRLRYLLVRGSLEWFQGQFETAGKTNDEALELAKQTGKLVELAESMLTRGGVAHSLGRWDDQLRTDLLAPHSPEVLSALHDGHLCAAEIHLYGGQPYEQIATFARDLQAEAERIGAKRAALFGQCLLGETALLTGDLALADTLLDQVATVSLELGARGVAALALQRRAESAIAAGEPDRARFLLAMALDQARNAPLGPRHLLQRVYGTKVLAAKDSAAAYAMVHEAESAIIGPTEGCWACLITFCVPAAIACAPHDLQRARKYLGTSEQMAKMFWRVGGWYAAVAEARGHVERAEGKAEAAQKSFLEAADLFARAGHKLEAERCRRGASFS